MPEQRPIQSGILLLDKPKGLSSNQALQRARRLFNRVKAGHTGSLDPMATGMLPICFGFATRVSHFLLNADKSYHAIAQLGVATDTGDAMGQVIEKSSYPEIIDVEALTRQFSGTIQQTPPMYSALHHNGKRLYELAREGKTVDRPARTVTIHALDLCLNNNQLEIKVRCSKGTYIRTLAEDIAKSMGTCAHLSFLRRTAVSPFTQDMISLETLEEIDDSERWDHLLGTDQALDHMSSYQANKQQSIDLLHGRAISPEPIPSSEEVRLYNEHNQFIGIAALAQNGQLHPKRIDPFFQSLL
ncbi:MAG: tRNA pseudouridine(55) synthase TruB [bacterium]